MDSPVQAAMAPEQDWTGAEGTNATSRSELTEAQAGVAIIAFYLILVNLLPEHMFSAP